MARWVYASGVAFNATNNDYFADMLRDVAAAGKGYKAPNINQLREQLLEAEYSRVKQQSEELHSTALRQTGCSVTSDGWTNTQHKPLLNVMFVTTSGAVFVDSVDTSGEIKV